MCTSLVAFRVFKAGKKREVRKKKILFVFISWRNGTDAYICSRRTRSRTRRRRGGEEEEDQEEEEEKKKEKKMEEQWSNQSNF